MSDLEPCENHDIEWDETNGPIILASQSPRRKQLVTSWGIGVQIQPPSDSAECGICAGESPVEFVARMAFQKAADVARKIEHGVIIAADTVAQCQGQILGKPVDRDHAESMLRLMSGTTHQVLTGLCLWHRPTNFRLGEVESTELKMNELDDEKLNQYLDSDGWIGKAGAFGYQDGLDWISIVNGNASNVVGLPRDRLFKLLNEMQRELGTR